MMASIHPKKESETEAEIELKTAVKYDDGEIYPNVKVVQSGDTAEHKPKHSLSQKKQWRVSVIPFSEQAKSKLAEPAKNAGSAENPSEPKLRDYDDVEGIRRENKIYREITARAIFKTKMMFYLMIAMLVSGIIYGYTQFVALNLNLIEGGFTAELNSHIADAAIEYSNAIGDLNFEFSFFMTVISGIAVFAYLFGNTKVHKWLKWLYLAMVLLGIVSIVLDIHSLVSNFFMIGYGGLGYFAEIYIKNAYAKLEEMSHIEGYPNFEELFDKTHYIKHTKASYTEYSAKLEEKKKRDSEIAERVKQNLKEEPEAAETYIPGVIVPIEVPKVIGDYELPEVPKRSTPSDIHDLLF
ncbi:MAG: hypothetical protein LBM87_03975 [Ruminococcus sp.]|jgi:hypothetical protein|nr:hypothetical protein [Ruminococcus sp.]